MQQNARFSSSRFPKQERRRTATKQSNPPRPRDRKKDAPFFLHPLALFGFFFSLFLLPRPLFCSLFLGVAVHEGGHLLAAALLGLRPRSLSILPFGFTLTYPSAPSYGGEIFIALAGPFCNGLSAVLASIFPLSYPFFSSFVPLSLSLFLFNLLPIPTFDGATSLFSLLSLFLPFDRAERIVKGLGALALTALWLAAVFVLFYSGENPILLISVAYLFAALFWQNGKNGLCYN